MCLGIPGQIVAWIDTDPVFARAEVDFGGVRRACHMACVPEAQVGDYVIIHAGIAIARVDADGARRLLDELSTLPEQIVDEMNLLERAGEAGLAGPDGSAGPAP